MSKASLGSLKLLAPIVNPSSNFAPMWLAEALGYAAEEGLDLTVECIADPKTAIEAVIAGEADTTFVNIVFPLLARARGAEVAPYYAFVRTQNRSFSVPRDSAIRSLADLKGKMIGLYYDDPELREFACAVLVGGGVDPAKDVKFKLLEGTPYDAPRMAQAIRSGDVQAIWQLDVLAGMMEVEGVPLRLIPSSLADALTPSSCMNARIDRLRSRSEAFGALGRCVAKATLFSLMNPEAAIRLMWKKYPSSGPKPDENAEHVFKSDLAALKVRLEGHRIEKALDPRWGAITEREASAWQDFLIKTGAIKTRRDPKEYYVADLVPLYNEFDPAPVIAQAKNFRA